MSQESVGPCGARQLLRDTGSMNTESEAHTSTTGRGLILTMDRETPSTMFDHGNCFMEFLWQQKKENCRDGPVVKLYASLVGRTGVQLSEPQSGVSQISVISAPGDLIPCVLHSHAQTHR